MCAADETLHAINDGIYGVCDLPREKLAEYRIPVTRWGGNPSNALQLGIWASTMRAATGSSRTAASCLPGSAKAATWPHIDGNQVLGATTYQTVPMIGWVAKDASSYGFSVDKYGPQKGTEPGNPDVGNGVLPTGGNVTGNDPARHLRARPAGVHRPGRALRRPVRRQGRRFGRQAGREVLGPR